ncbi:MAG: lytic transglycosylase domain-containing protein [Actinomycetota bacterium]|jgi:hypothetical protein|nr:lytic transglycosylase domain-containing protein [Actinomycetota bacterium]
MLSVVSTPAVVAEIQALETTLGSLGQSLAAAAPTGGFGDVLGAVRGEMAGIGASAVPGPTPSTSAAAGGHSSGTGSSTAFLATANLLGAGSGPGGLDLLGSPSTASSLLTVPGSLAGLMSAYGTAAEQGGGGVPSMPGSSGGGIPASLGVPSGLVALFEQASSRFGVPAALLAAVARQESGFDPSAVSSAGAEGLMQLMPSTAAGLGVDAFDPRQAVDGAATLLSSYLRQYGGSVPLALAAYNAGPNAVARYGGIPPYTQTQNYVRDIMASLGVVP